MFNEEEFLGSSVNGANSTTIPNIPPNKYAAIIKDVRARQSQGKKDASKTYTWLDLQLDVQLDVEAKSVLKRDTFGYRYSFSLDLTEAGGIDMSEGANIQLGRLRKALGQNDPTRPFIPREMVGQMISVEFGAPEADDQGILRDRVKSVSAFS